MGKYRSLCKELTGTEKFASSERWRINQRVERLNDLGFDIEELSMRTDDSGSEVVIQPKVVDAGHHSRRLLRLTGLDAQDNQARRLLNDLDSYRVAFGKEKLDEEVVAHEWTARVFEPVIAAIPRELRGKLEPAEIFHQLLDHRWYLSQNESRDVPLAEAVTQLRRHRAAPPPRRGDGGGPADRRDDAADRRGRRRGRGLAHQGLTSAAVRSRRGSTPDVDAATIDRVARGITTAAVERAARDLAGRRRRRADDSSSWRADPRARLRARRTAHPPAPGRCPCRDARSSTSASFCQHRRRPARVIHLRTGDEADRDVVEVGDRADGARDHPGRAPSTDGLG